MIKLKQLRLQKGLTQKELAQKLNIAYKNTITIRNKVVYIDKMVENGV